MNSYNSDTFHGSFYGGSKRFAEAKRNALIEGMDYTIGTSDPIGVGAADNMFVQGLEDTGSFAIEGRISDASPWAPVIVAKVGDRSEKAEEVSDTAAWVADVHNFYQVKITGTAGKAVIVKLENLGIK